MKIIKYIALFGMLSGLAVACTPSTSVISNDVVRLNQLGYYPNQEKIAVIDSGKVEEFVILDAGFRRTSVCRKIFIYSKICMVG